MQGLSAAMTWVAFAAGVLVTIDGLATLMVRRLRQPLLIRRDRGVGWHRLGWGVLLLGAFLLVETIPRLAGASTFEVLVLSLVALGPLIGAIVMMFPHHSIPRR